MLPECWHVIVNDENKKALQKWTNENLGCINIYNGYVLGMAKWEDGVVNVGYDFRLYENTSYSFGEEITFERFKYEILKEIPEKWYMEISTDNEWSAYIQWRSRQKNLFGRSREDYLRVHSNNFKIEGNRFVSYYGYHDKDIFKDEGLVKITFEDFMDKILNRNLLGYKAPYNLFNDKILKENLYVNAFQYLADNDSYIPLNEKNNLFKHIYKLPKEIVEIWEPVFEEVDYSNIEKSEALSKEEILLDKIQKLLDEYRNK